MILTLIALVILLISVGGMLRATDTSTSIVGNLAFRRDLTNRAEIAIAAAKAQLNSGLVFSSSARESDNSLANYSATRLAPPPGAGAMGVPHVLISDNEYTAALYTCIPASCTAGTDGVLLRWVIDRQCTAGTTTFTTAACGYVNTTKDAGGTNFLKKPTGASRGLFRISVRVSGPRNTEAYIQTTAG
ncbi:MAG: hypothetical protein ABIR54_03460 [Burkholderiaceae bacterium]